MEMNNQPDNNFKKSKKSKKAIVYKNIKENNKNLLLQKTITRKQQVTNKRFRQNC